MKTELFLQNAHLLLGITRNELERRLNGGQLDPEILKAQIEQSSQDTKLGALCEQWIELKSLDQIDKFSADE